MKFLFCTLLLLSLCSLTLAAADVDGTWYSEVSRDGPNGPVNVKTTLTLKAEEGKLAGTLEQAFGEREFPAADIQEGKIEGNKFSFVVKREFNGNEFVVKYEGALEGDVFEGNFLR